MFHHHSIYNFSRIYNIFFHYKMCSADKMTTFIRTFLVAYIREYLFIQSSNLCTWCNGDVQVFEDCGANHAPTPVDVVRLFDKAYDVVTEALSTQPWMRYCLEMQFRDICRKQRGTGHTRSRFTTETIRNYVVDNVHTYSEVLRIIMDDAFRSMQRLDFRARRCGRWDAQHNTSPLDELD